MTLHEAIIKVLQQKGRTMSTQEIADELNKNGLYSKKDDSSISDFQIHGRTRKYPHLFNRDGIRVSLKSNATSPTKPQNPSQQINKSTNQQKVPSVAKVASVAIVAPVPKVPQVPLNDLMHEKNFKPADKISHLLPDEPGLYCIRIDKADNLPQPFATHLKNRNHNILYIGIATTSLRQRISQELWAEGHGTFFRGLGAVLGYRPPKGSLLNRKNKNNYTFSSANENQIIQWINAHLLVNWVSFNGNFENTETILINTYLPLMNAAKNPAKLPELAALRKECREIANDLQTN
jgi:hypothetical protein